ncbi:MAG: hypothetical protein JWM27_2326, partial [Gemmatimonadetes bacterium]|nr:hypothetical protein [Gemmatimonadota bacterium]
MSDALAYLRGRQRAGRVRFALRRLRTARGAVGAVVTAAFLLLVFGGRLARLWAGAPPAAPEAVLRYGATGMALLALLGVVASRGLAFSPAEVEFLFPAPVSRRDLMRHYLLSRLWVQGLAALWVSLYATPMAALPLAALAAVVAWLAFSFVCTVGAAQLRAWLDGVLPARTRTVAAWVVGIVAALEAARAVYAAWRAGSADAALDAPALRLLRVPALPFAHLFAARSAGEALAWSAACAALTAGMAACVLGADVDMRERSLAATGRVQRRRERMRGARGDGDARDEPVRRA